MITDFSKEAFRAAMAAEVEGNEDFVYQRKKSGSGFGKACLYVFEGKPDCLIGRTLARMGAPVQELSGWDGRHDNAANSVMRAMGFSEDVYYAARSAQATQDEGFTWGEALAYFDSCEG